MQKYKVFSKETKALVDQLALVVGRSLAHQSSREWERAVFPHGITTDAQKNGHEERCVILILLLIFCSARGSHFEQLMGGTRLSNFVLVESLMLLIENFQRTKSFPSGLRKRLQKFMPLFLDFYKTAVNRTSGKGLDIIKFHLPLHLAEDLKRFGPATSYDSSAGESNHKLYKSDCKRTSRNTDSSEFQVGHRQHERYVMARDAYEQRPPTINDPPAQHLSEISPRGLYLLCDKEGLWDPKRGRKTIPARRWPDLSLMLSVEAFIWNHLQSALRCGDICVHSSCRVGDTLYRADPFWKADASTKFGWHDWAFVSWPAWSSHPFPARIVCFLELQIDASSPIVDPADDQRQFTNGGIYALVQAPPQSLYECPQDGEDGENYLAHQCTRLIYKSGLSTDSQTPPQPVLYLVEVSTMFVEPCVAVPYDLENPDGSEYLFLEPQSQWQKILYNWMGELLQQHRS